MASVDLTPCIKLTTVEKEVFYECNESITVSLPGLPIDWTNGTNIINKDNSGSATSRTI